MPLLTSQTKRVRAKRSAKQRKFAAQNKKPPSNAAAVFEP
jgi:hypothetical protein